MDRVDIEFFEKELTKWRYSPQRMMMLDGERYYLNDHDILKRERMVIGEGGKLEKVDNLPNNRILDNQYKKMVNQKANYLLSKPITFECENQAFADALDEVFNRDFLNKIKNGGIDALNGGLFWLYPYYDENGAFKFMRFKPYEILPFWRDSEHTDLDAAARMYRVHGYDENGRERDWVKVEIFMRDSIERFDFTNGHLVPDVENPVGYYAYIGDQGYSWEKNGKKIVPLIAFKYNPFETPLIKSVKGLQDALNLMHSDLMNNMQEDNRNTVLVIKNYDGQDLGEFRRNLSAFGAVKVRTVDGADGGIEALKVDVNATNYELVLKTIKKAIIENAMGYDAKDDRMGSNANMMNLRSMYADIDLDADSMEAEFQASFEQLLFFVKSYLSATGKGNFENEKVVITFNRDIIVNETEIIDNLVKLGVKLPNELLVSQVPFVDNVDEVMEKLKAEEETEMNRMYKNAFNEKEEE